MQNPARAFVFESSIGSKCVFPAKVGQKGGRGSKRGSSLGLGSGWGYKKWVRVRENAPKIETKDVWAAPAVFCNLAKNSYRRFFEGRSPSTVSVPLSVLRYLHSFGFCKKNRHCRSANAATTKRRRSSWVCSAKEFFLFLDVRNGWRKRLDEIERNMKHLFRWPRVKKMGIGRGFIGERA